MEQVLHNMILCFPQGTVLPMARYLYYLHTNIDSCSITVTSVIVLSQHCYIVNCNVNVHAYSPDISVSSADCTIYTLGIETHSFCSFISSGDNAALCTLPQL